MKSKGPKASYVVMSWNHKPMYALVKEVTIKAQLGMRHEGQEEVKTLMSELKKATTEAIR